MTPHLKALNKLNVMSLDSQDRANYKARLKQIRDLKSIALAQEENFRVQERSIGIEEGKKEEKIKIAKNLLSLAHYPDLIRRPRV